MRFGRRKRAEPLPELTPSDELIEIIAIEAEETEGLTRRLIVTIAFTLDEEEFHESDSGKIAQLLDNHHASERQRYS